MNKEDIAIKMLVRFKEIRSVDRYKPSVDIGIMEELYDVVLKHSKLYPINTCDKCTNIKFSRMGAKELAKYEAQDDFVYPCIFCARYQSYEDKYQPIKGE